MSAATKRLSALPRSSTTLQSIIVEGPDGEALIAERVRHLDGVLYEARLPDGLRFYRLAQSGGGVRVEDATAETASAIERRRALLRGETVRVAAQRAARLKKLAEDHYERTRRSFILDGQELGFVKPTAETQGKLGADPLARLLAKGSLTEEQVRAGLEIRDIYRMVSAGLFARAAPVERTGRSRSPVSERLAHLHRDRYLPWAAYLGGSANAPAVQAGTIELPGRAARHGTLPVAVEITIDIVIDGKSLAEVECERRWRHAMAGEILRYALAVYSQLAGWERNGALIAAFEAKWRRRRERAGPPVPRAKTA